VQRTLRSFERESKQLRAEAQRGNPPATRSVYARAGGQSRREPHLHGFYEHLLAKGKTKRLALMAVARKLLHAIYGMLFRSGKSHDGARVYQLPAPLATPTPLAQHTT
jgi:hypothetical protein